MRCALKSPSNKSLSKQDYFINNQDHPISYQDQSINYQDLSKSRQDCSKNHKDHKDARQPVYNPPGLLYNSQERSLIHRTSV